jgi:hypothetical protein
MNKDQLISTNSNGLTIIHHKLENPKFWKQWWWDWNEMEDASSDFEVNLILLASFDLMGN